jgi:hypothetical protein
MPAASPPVLASAKEHHVARLDKTLADLGFDIDPDAFKDVLSDTFDSMYAGMLPSIDELLVRPTEALRYCVAIRDRLRNFDLPEDVILRTLLNTRKHP